MIVRVVSYPQGPRCWVANQRIHHGAVGIVAALALRKHPRIAACALLATLHDRHDWRVWFARESCPNVSALTSGLDGELSIV